jgi:hypothetical protein
MSFSLCHDCSWGAANYLIAAVFALLAAVLVAWLRLKLGR